MRNDIQSPSIVPVIMCAIACIGIIIGAMWFYIIERKETEVCKRACDPYVVLYCDVSDKLIICKSNEGAKVFDLK
jgi:hypothetical protein